MKTKSADIYESEIGFIFVSKLRDSDIWKIKFKKQGTRHTERVLDIQKIEILYEGILAFQYFMNDSVIFILFTIFFSSCVYITFNMSVIIRE